MNKSLEQRCEQKTVSLDYQIAISMTQLVLEEHIRNILHDFEEKVGAEIGFVRIGAKQRKNKGKRDIKIDVKNINNLSMPDLVEYKRLIKD